MPTVRDAEKGDIENIAALFNSDPKYYDPFFNTPEMIVKHHWERMEGRRLVAVDNGQIVGFLAAEDYWLSGWQGTGKVAEPKKLFVHPAYQGQGISHKLYAELEKILADQNYDAAIVSSVTGHIKSQRVFLQNGYSPAAFAPLWAEADMTRRGQRESMLFMVKYLKPEFLKEVRAPKRSWIVDGAREVAEEAYRLTNLLSSREIDYKPSSQEIAANFQDRTPQQQMTDTSAWLAREIGPEGDTGAVANPVLPQLPLILTQTLRVLYREKATLAGGCIPTGVLPLGIDIMLMQYVPHLPENERLKFDFSKVDVMPEAAPLAHKVVQLYNGQLTRELARSV